MLICFDNVILQQYESKCLKSSFCYMYVQYVAFEVLFCQMLNYFEDAMLTTPGLKKSTLPLVFTDASGCRARENYDSSSENYILHICQYFK